VSNEFAVGVWGESGNFNCVVLEDLALVSYSDVFLLINSTKNVFLARLKISSLRMVHVDRNILGQT
jgi:hypothetical protein